jgi:flagellar hook-length control protein FliK
MADFPLPPVTAHSVTHGAASARAAHALASGTTGDAASDLAGADAFAALLSQVAPEAVAGRGPIHGKGKHSASQENDNDPSDALDAPDDKSVPANDKITALSDKKPVADDKNIVAADPSQITPQDSAKADDAHKAGRHKKEDDHKSVHHRKAAADAAVTLAPPVIPTAVPVAANLAMAADTDTEQADEASLPSIDGLQATPAGGAPVVGRSVKAAKAEKPSSPSQTSPANPQTDADAPGDGNDPATLLAQAVNRIVADAFGAATPAPQPKTSPATATGKTDPAHIARNTANPASPSNPANPAATAAAAQIAAATQPATPPTVQQPVVPQIAGVTAVSAPQAPAAPQPVALSLHPAAPSPDSLPNLNSFALDIAAKSHDGLKQFDIRMDPPELGRVDVRLSIDNSGKVQAHLTADQPQTLALLQKDSTVLRGALRDAGLNMAQNGLNFSLKGQNPEQRSANNGGSARGRSLSIRATAAIDAAQSVIPVFSSVGADTRLDIHV